MKSIGYRMVNGLLQYDKSKSNAIARVNVIPDDVAVSLQNKNAIRIAMLKPRILSVVRTWNNFFYYNRNELQSKMTKFNFLKFFFKMIFILN